MTSRSKLYAILLIACMAGYIWLLYGITNQRTESKSIEVCLIKHATNIPCPSCGSTKAVISLIEGNFFKALSINPFGIIIAAIMLITPLWILFDVASKRQSLYDFYKRTEFFLKKPSVAIPLVLLVVINWIWNITKAL